MALKLAEDKKDNKIKEDIGLSDAGYQQSGLHLSGEENRKLESGIDRGERNPWDVGRTVDTMGVSSITDTVGTEDLQKKSNDSQSIVLEIGKIVISIMLVLELAAVMWCCTQDLHDLYFNFIRFQALTSLATIVFLIDSIMVNVLYEKRKRLIFLALFFGFLYPMCRNKFVDGRGGTGNFLFVGSIMTLIMATGTVSDGLTKYGTLLMVEDEVARDIAADVMDQYVSVDTRFGDKLLRCFEIQNVAVGGQDEEQVVAFIGNGRLYYEDMALCETAVSATPTRLLFQKAENSGEYELVRIVLNDREVPPKGIEVYWNYIMSW